MTPVRRKNLAIRRERIQHRPRSLAGNSPAPGPQIPEARVSSATGLDKLPQQIGRPRPLRLAQRRVNRLNALLAVNLTPRHLQDRQVREFLNRRGSNSPRTSPPPLWTRARTWPDAAPASTILAAILFTSHSQGPRMDSSKSFRSNTSDPSGAAKDPRFCTCASPHNCTFRPECGSRPRSAAMIETAPRKKAKGETFMRPYLMGRSWRTRPSAAARKTSRGSNRRSFGRNSACAARLTVSRRLLPKRVRSS